MYLLDINTLIALAWDNHQSHETAHAWFVTNGDDGFATCHVTQSGFLRLCLNPNVVKTQLTANQALEKLRSFLLHPRHNFWEDGQLETNSSLWKTVHHRDQVTDLILFLIARRRDGTLATFDKGLQTRLPASEHRWVKVIS